MKAIPLYQALQACLVARRGIESPRFTGDYARWSTDWDSRVAQLAALLPSGSGIDCGTKIDRERCTDDRIVLTCGFRHMDAHGGYDGWTEHVITVKADLLGGLSLTISGRNRNDIKDYLHQVYDAALHELVTFDREADRYFSAAVAVVE